MLAFDQAAHRYTWNGKFVPHVTGILKPLTSYDRIPESVLNAARDEGIAIHKMVELDCFGDLDTDKLPSWMLGHHRAWRRFLDDTGFTFISSESKVFHPVYRYAGTLDLSGQFSKALIERLRTGLSIIDVKRSFFAGPAIGPQVAAYEAAWNATHDKALRASNRFALQLRANGTYRLEACEDPSDFQTFLACLTLYNWKIKHAK